MNDHYFPSKSEPKQQSLPSTGVVTIGKGGARSDIDRPFYSSQYGTAGRQHSEVRGSKKKKNRRPRPRKFDEEDFPGLAYGYYFKSYQDYSDNIEWLLARENMQAGDTDDIATKAHEHRKPHEDYNSAQYSLPPPKAMANDTYELYDEVAHMRYVVCKFGERYYAVWISLDTVCDLTQAMRDTRKQLADKHGAGVIITMPWGRFYRTGPQASYGGASSYFRCGGETPWRSRDRISEATKPDWIPKNIRALAYEGGFEALNQVDPATGADNRAIYKRYKALVDAWVAKGHPGWWKGKHEPRRKPTATQDGLWDLN